MKSLEIINQTINTFDTLKDASLFIDKNNIDVLLKIQKDLEVLEIMKKFFNEIFISKEEEDKLDKWLEEEEWPTKNNRDYSK